MKTKKLLESLDNSLEKILQSSAGIFLKKSVEEEYAPRFSKLGALWLSKKGISFDRANAYPARFDADDIASFIKNDISPDLTLEYPEGLPGWNIKYLHEKDISGARAAEYPPKYDGFDIERFEKSNANPKNVHSYPESFSPKLIAFFERNGGTPEIAKEFVFRRYIFSELAENLKHEFEKKKSDSRKPLQDLISVARKTKHTLLEHLLQRRVPDSTSNRFDFLDLLMLSFTARQDDRPLVDWDSALEYPEDYGGILISNFKGKDVTPELSVKLSKRFSKTGLLLMQDEKIDLQTALNYDSSLNAFKISFLYNAGLTPEVIGKKEQQQLGDLLEGFYKFTLFNDFKFRESNPDHQSKLGGYQFVGSGASGFVVFKNYGYEKTAFKISYVADSEQEILEKLKDAHKDKEAGLENVVSIKSKNSFVGKTIKKWFKIPKFFELEYIEGKNLSTLLDIEKSFFDYPKTLKYSKDIFNGLLELKSAGIYHRDLWLGNVMIDEVQDRAVIIDLGIATDDPGDGPKDNRRYGGENDLHSLGQIMYKMATGEHLFNPSINMSTHLIPEEIKEERERSYADQATLQKRLKEVEVTIQDNNLASLIKFCLEAKGTEEDYQRLEERFTNVN